MKRSFIWLLFMLIAATFAGCGGAGIGSGVSGTSNNGGTTNNTSVLSAYGKGYKHMIRNIG